MIDTSMRNRCSISRGGMADLQPPLPAAKDLRGLKEGRDREAIQVGLPAVLAIKKDHNRAFDLTSVPCCRAVSLGLRRFIYRMPSHRLF